MSLSNFKQPFGVYATPTSVGPQTTRALLITSINNLMNLIPSPTTGVATTYAPDFDQIPPHTAAKIRAELTALRKSISVSPSMTTAQLP